MRAIVAIQNVYAALPPEIGHSKGTRILSSSPKKAKFALLPLPRKPIDFVNFPEETKSMDW
jgi:hypothetical protein